ncbi:MAG TPA: pyridoxal phosphate-dependent aminotransferase family protein, partial [Thermomicrobiales bacterium]|nr:pyridoxal phosphate-dependent aminotransferase family protein [Thermomicrobiales bacterium]
VGAVDGPRVRIAGRWVLNFTSSNYLGLSHDPEVRERTAATVRRWGSSLAMPRLLATDSLTAQLERKLAGLVHAEAALLFPSTLHAAHDVLSLLAGDAGLIAIDERAYPISLAAARSVAWPNGEMRRFQHDDPESLARLLAERGQRDAVVICDGVYPANGAPASVRAIGRVAASAGATVYVDDAHGLGVLGAHPGPAQPYGYGGGGTLRYSGAQQGNIAYVSSLSKALGVPLAFAAGPARFIEYLRLTSASVTHSSPPCQLVVAAALATLDRQVACGDALRRRLLYNVRHFRAEANRLGLPLTSNSLFPIQSIAFASPAAAIASGRRLRLHDIWPVLALRPEDHPTGATLRFVITALHTKEDIDEAIDALARTAACQGRFDDPALEWTG